MSIKNAIANFRFAIQTGQLWGKLSATCRWSILAKIGRSRIVGLTIAAPLFGYMIIFNENIINLLRLDVLLASNEQGTIRPIWYLYYVYFGLICLGMASALFAVFCPEQIARHNTVGEYIQDQEKIWTPLLTRGALDRILMVVVDFMTMPDGSFRSVVGNNYFPYHVSVRTEELLREIFEQTRFSENDLDGISEVFYSGSMGLSIDKVAEVMYSRPNVSRIFWSQLLKSAEGHSKDIFYVDYVVLDHSSYIIRFLTVFLYMVGFLLLFIPSASTVVKILASLLGHTAGT